MVYFFLVGLQILEFGIQHVDTYLKSVILSVMVVYLNLLNLQELATLEPEHGFLLVVLKTIFPNIDWILILNFFLFLLQKSVSVLNHSQRAFF
jgi:hypothetical protein